MPIKRQARNFSSDITVDLFEVLGVDREPIGGFACLTRRGGEYGYVEFSQAEMACGDADMYFEMLCTRFHAEPGMSCPDCKGAGGHSYQETYGLSHAERWGQTGTEWDECHCCGGTGWAGEAADDDTGPDYEPEEPCCYDTDCPF